MWLSQHNHKHKVLSNDPKTRNTHQFGIANDGLYGAFQLDNTFDLENVYGLVKIDVNILCKHNTLTDHHTSFELLMVRNVIR